VSVKRLEEVDESIVTTWYVAGSIDAKAKFILKTRKRLLPICPNNRALLTV